MGNIKLRTERPVGFLKTLSGAKQLHSERYLKNLEEFSHKALPLIFPMSLCLCANILPERQILKLQLLFTVELLKLQTKCFLGFVSANIFPLLFLLSLLGIFVNVNKSWLFNIYQELESLLILSLLPVDQWLTIINAPPKANESLFSSPN